MEQSPSWEANWFSASQEIPHIYGTWKFITAFTNVRQLSLPWARSIQSIPPHPNSWRFILILSSPLRLGLPSGLISSGFPTEKVYTVNLTSPHTRYMHSPSNSSQFYHPKNTGWTVQIIKFSTYLSPHPCYLVPLGPKYSPQHPILKHPQPSSPLNVSDQVSHPHKTKGKIIVL